MKEDGSFFYLSSCRLLASFHPSVFPWPLGKNNSNFDLVVVVHEGNGRFGVLAMENTDEDTWMATSCSWPFSVTNKVSIGVLRKIFQDFFRINWV